MGTPDSTPNTASRYAVEASDNRSTGTDCLKTIDCDAVVFHSHSYEVKTSERFWTSLENGVVDINLEANPNYIGTLARTLRILLEWKQDLGPRLSGYLASGMMDSYEEVLNYVVQNGLGRRLPPGTDRSVVVSHLSAQTGVRCRHDVFHHMQSQNRKDDRDKPQLSCR